MEEYTELAAEVERDDKAATRAQFSTVDISGIAIPKEQSRPKFGSMLSAAISIESEYERAEQLKSRQRPRKPEMPKGAQVQYPTNTAARQLQDAGNQNVQERKPSPLNVFNFNLSSNANAPKAASERPLREQTSSPVKEAPGMQQTVAQQIPPVDHVQQENASDARVIEKAKMERELDDLRSRKDELESAAMSNEKKLNEYQERLEGTKSALEKAKQALQSSKSDYEKMVLQQSKETASMQQQIDSLVSKREGLEERIKGTPAAGSEQAERLKSLNEEKTKLSEEIAAMESRKESMEATARSGSKQIDEYYRKLNDTKSELARAQSDLKGARDEYDSMKRRTAKELEGSRTSISDLDRKRQELEDRIRKNRIMQEQMEMELQKRRDELSRQETARRTAEEDARKNAAQEKAKRELAEAARRLKEKEPMKPSFQERSGLLMVRLSAADQASELQKIMEGLQERVFDEVQLRIIRREVHGLMRELSRKREKYSVGSTDIERSLSILRDERLREVIALLGAS